MKRLLILLIVFMIAIFAYPYQQVIGKVYKVDDSQFWQGGSGGYAVGGLFDSWNGGEPNDSNGFAISEWHDTDAVMAKLNALLSQPIRPIRRASSGPGR